jgi:hypothetical protein
LQHHFSEAQTLETLLRPQLNLLGLEPDESSTSVPHVLPAILKIEQVCDVEIRSQFYDF